MGFMDISIVGSDAASDFTYAVGNTIAQMMLVELKAKHSGWNTSGCVNVALFFEEVIVPSGQLQFNDSLINVAKRTHKSLEKWFQVKNRNPKLDPDYKRLMKVLNGFIERSKQ